MVTVLLFSRLRSRQLSSRYHFFLLPPLTPHCRFFKECLACFKYVSEPDSYFELIQALLSIEKATRVADNRPVIEALEGFCLREKLVDGAPALAASLLVQIYTGGKAGWNDAAKFTQLFTIFLTSTTVASATSTFLLQKYRVERSVPSLSEAKLSSSMFFF